MTLSGNTGIRFYIFNSKIGWFKWTFNSFTSAGPHCIWNRNPRTLKTVLIKSLQWFVPFVAQIIKAWLLIKIPGSVSSSVTWHKGLVHRWKHGECWRKTGKGEWLVPVVYRCNMENSMHKHVEEKVWRALQIVLGIGRLCTYKINRFPWETHC